MNQTNQSPHHALLTILIASTINRLLTHYDSMNVKLDVSLFLNYLQSTIGPYKDMFGTPTSEYDINTKEDLIRNLEGSALSEFLLFDGDCLQIKADSVNYSNHIKNIILESATEYAKFLLGNVNDLAKKYTYLKTLNDDTIPSIIITDKDNNRDVQVEKQEVKAFETNESDENDQVTESVELKINNKDDKIQETKQSSSNDKEQSPTDEENESSQLSEHESEVNNTEESSSDELDREQTPHTVISDQVETDDHDHEKEEIKTPRRSSRKRSASPAITPGHNQKKFQSIATSLINNIQSHRFSSVFLQPVNKKEIPDYYDVVYEPKDLKSMMKEVKVKTNPKYTLLPQLERDILLMFANCIMFNHSDEHLVKLARTMRDDVVSSFNLFREAEQ